MQILINYFKTNKKTLLVLLAVLVFFITLFVHYLPILVKGYSPALDTDNLVLARNIHLTGEKVIENDLSIYLSSDLLKESGGIPAASFNKLTPLIYSWLFDIFGFHQDIPLYVSLICLSLVSALLFLLFNRLFNLSIALIGAGVSALVPTFWWESIQLGFYELAVLFFIVGLFFYLYPKKSNIYTLVFASIFFALAVLSRNAFLISFLAIIVFEFCRNRSLRKVIWLGLPLALIVGAVFFFDFQAGTNPYFSSNSGETFSDYGHLFPDAYVYHFEAESYLKSIKDQAGGDVAGRILSRGGYQGFESVQKRFQLFYNSIQYYARQFFRPTILGGPLAILFLFIGFYYLQKKNKALFSLFIIWLVILSSALVYLGTSNHDHFLEILSIISLAIALGIYYFIDLIFYSSLKNIKKIIFVSVLLFGTFVYLLGIDYWMFSREYGGENIAVKIHPLIEVLNNSNLDSKSDVVAVGVHSAVVGILNYYTNKNYIYFDPQTLERLVEEKKVNEAFEYFGVTHIAGFDNNLSQRVSEVTDVLVIQ